MSHNTTKHHQLRAWPILRDFVLITLGALLVATGVTIFLVPNQVVTGGVTGISILLNTYLGTPVGLVVLLFNIPLFVIGFRRLGGFVFGVRTIYATTVMALLIDWLPLYLQPVTADPLLYSLYGGLLDGIGLGLVLRARGTTGGSDIVARVIEQRFGIQPGRSLLTIDSLIFAAAFASYGPEKILYALLVAFISSRALDYTLAAGNGARQALIVTTRPSDITGALLRDLQRGVTILEGYGGYTGARRAVLLCVVARTEISALRTIVGRVDPQAFVVIGEVREVLGEGFRPVSSDPLPRQPEEPASMAPAQPVGDS